ncbi:MAG: hypothetical protein WBE79_05785 [Candidatus Cybelea sp.]
MDRLVGAVFVVLLLWPAPAARAVGAELRLEPFSHVYAVDVAIKGKHVATSRWQDVLERVTIGGRQVYRRTQISTQSNGIVRTWISVFDASDFSAVSDTFDTSEGDMFGRVFGSGEVTDYSSLGKSRGVLTTQKAWLPVHYSDFNSGLFGLALLRLPLAVGYSTTLTTFGPTDARPQSVPIEVLREEALPVGTCSFDALVVRAAFSARDYPDEGDNFMTFWLVKRAPYVARLVTEAPQSGLVVSFDLDDTGISCPAEVPQP